ncbi:hypothetical protein [Peribacillus butanolivorans]|uniref:hypothetical protein n=1 Tax=Peribacillus butanolivorans TaxID=421767 RepID=UPI00365B90BC
MKNQVKVVVAIIENEKDEILCSLRYPEMTSRTEDSKWKSRKGRRYYCIKT